MFSFIRTAAVLLPVVCTSGAPTEVASLVEKSNIAEDEILQQLEHQEHDAETRRKDLENEASLDSSLVETKRLMRQEMRSDKLPSIPYDQEWEVSDEPTSPLTSKHQRRQQRPLKRSAHEMDTSLLAGIPGLTNIGAEESEKDIVTQSDTKTTCPNVYKVRGAEVIQPLRMGIFWRVANSRLPLWESSNKEYLYFSPEYLEWRIGDDYRKSPAGVASTPHEFAECPHKAKDWFAYNAGNWTTQYNITIESEECPLQVWITGALNTHPTHMGTFYLTLHENAGRPVYENEHHMYLHYWPEFGEWRIGEDWQTAKSGVASSRGQQVQCPTDATGWTVYHLGAWIEAGVEVAQERPASLGGAPTKPHPDDFFDAGAHSNEAQAATGNLTYKEGLYGESQCPFGSREMTEAECRQAAPKMETVFAGLENDESRPRGCFMDKPEGKEVIGHIFFNKHVLGLPSEGHKPLCHTEFGPFVPQKQKTEVRRRGEKGEEGDGEEGGKRGRRGGKDEKGGRRSGEGGRRSGEGGEDGEGGEASKGGKGGKGRRGRKDEEGEDAEANEKEAKQAQSTDGTSTQEHDTEKEEEEAAVTEHEQGDHHHKKGGGKFILLVIVIIVILIIAVYFYRKRGAAAAEKAALLEKVDIGTAVIVKSDRSKGVVSEFGTESGGEKTFKLTLEDGTTPATEYKAADLKLVEEPQETKQ